MSDKFFFKGRKSPRPKYEGFGFNTKRASKLGTQDQPLTLVVATIERQAELEAIVETHKLFANIEINPEVAENTLELDGMFNKPETTRFKKTPSRNDACICGSGKKYKKCCG